MCQHRQESAGNQSCPFQRCRHSSVVIKRSGPAHLAAAPTNATVVMQRSHVSPPTGVRREPRERSTCRDPGEGGSAVAFLMKASESRLMPTRQCRQSCEGTLPAANFPARTLDQAVAMNAPTTCTAVVQLRGCPLNLPGHSGLGPTVIATMGACCTATAGSGDVVPSAGFPVERNQRSDKQIGSYLEF